MASPLSGSDAASDAVSESSSGVMQNVAYPSQPMRTEWQVYGGYGWWKGSIGQNKLEEMFANWTRAGSPPGMFFTIRGNLKTKYRFDFKRMRQHTYVRNAAGTSLRTVTRSLKRIVVVNEEDTIRQYICCRHPVPEDESRAIAP